MEKSIVLSFFLFFFSFTQLSAHTIWIDTNPTGTIGNAQQVQVYYGEYSYNYYEKVDGNFQDVADFTIWATRKKIRVNLWDFEAIRHVATYAVKVE